MISKILTGNVLLKWAINKKNINDVKILLNEGLDTNVSNFTTACYSNNIEIIKLFLNNGAYIDNMLLKNVFWSKKFKALNYLFTVKYKNSRTKAFRFLYNAK